MWINAKTDPPKYQAQGGYICFGVDCRGNNEKPTKFIAYWGGASWEDKDGEDLIGINDSVEYYLDFHDIEDPITEEIG